MTIAEAEKFYEQDQKKYEVAKNIELLKWLEKSIKNGYHSFIGIEELQDLINNIVNWYEIKYPEREMEYYEGIRYYDFEKIEILSSGMKLKQLMYRLPHKQLCLMNCNYRACGASFRDIYNEKGEVIDWKSVLFMVIRRKNVENNNCCILDSKPPYFLLHADSDTGQVDIDYNLDNLVNNTNITLDDLLILFNKKYKDQLEFTELEECVYDHNCDMKLRRKILQMVALKLLYSDKTIPERGYERAKRFINEFNKKLCLNLTTEEIDEIMNRDYSNKEKQLNSIIKEDVFLEKIDSLSKTKKLVKSIFKK